MPDKRAWVWSTLTTVFLAGCAMLAFLGDPGGRQEFRNAVVSVSVWVGSASAWFRSVDWAGLWAWIDQPRTWAILGSAFGTAVTLFAAAAWRKAGKPGLVWAFRNAWVFYKNAFFAPVRLIRRSWVFVRPKPRPAVALILDALRRPGWVVDVDRRTLRGPDVEQRPGLDGGRLFLRIDDVMAMRLCDGGGYQYKAGEKVLAYLVEGMVPIPLSKREEKIVRKAAMRVLMSAVLLDLKRKKDEADAATAERERRVVEGVEKVKATIEAADRLKELKAEGYHKVSANQIPQGIIDKAVVMVEQMTAEVGKVVGNSQAGTNYTVAVLPSVPLLSGAPSTMPAGWTGENFGSLEARAKMAEQRVVELTGEVASLRDLLNLSRLEANDKREQCKNLLRIKGELEREKGALLARMKAIAEESVENVARFAATEAKLKAQADKADAVWLEADRERNELLVRAKRAEEGTCKGCNKVVKVVREERDKLAEELAELRDRHASDLKGWQAGHEESKRINLQSVSDLMNERDQLKKRLDGMVPRINMDAVMDQRDNALRELANVRERYNQESVKWEAVKSTLSNAVEKLKQEREDLQESAVTLMQQRDGLDKELREIQVKMAPVLAKAKENEEAVAELRAKFDALHAGARVVEGPEKPEVKGNLRWEKRRKAGQRCPTCNGNLSAGKSSWDGKDYSEIVQSMCCKAPLEMEWRLVGDCPNCGGSGRKVEVMEGKVCQCSNCGYIILASNHPNPAKEAEQATAKPEDKSAGLDALRWEKRDDDKWWLVGLCNCGCNRKIECPQSRVSVLLAGGGQSTKGWPPIPS